MCESSTREELLSNNPSSSDDDQRVVIEVTGTDGNYMDSIVVEDFDEVTEYLDGFVGAVGTAPAMLDYMTPDGDVIGGREHILWGIASSGKTISWRSVQAA